MTLNIQEIKDAEALQTIILPLIVPSSQEVLHSKDLDLSKSDLNACYSKPLVNEKTGKKQSWYDVQLIIGPKDNLPSRKEWFYMVTDNGYIFKACFAGKKIKRLSTFEDKRIIGRWIKDRLVEWDLLYGFQFVSQDWERIGIITKEMLDIYGNDQIFIKKTNKTRKDKNGIERDIWFIAFSFKVPWWE